MNCKKVKKLLCVATAATMVYANTAVFAIDTQLAETPSTKVVLNTEGTSRTFPFLIGEPYNYWKIQIDSRTPDYMNFFIQKGSTHGETVYQGKVNPYEECSFYSDVAFEEGEYYITVVTDGKANLAGDFYYKTVAAYDALDFLVPLNEQAESYGYTVDMTEDGRITLEKEDRKIQLKVGEDTILVNGKAIDRSAVPVLIDEKVNMPNWFYEILSTEHFPFLMTKLSGHVGAETKYFSVTEENPNLEIQVENTSQIAGFPNHYRVFLYRGDELLYQCYAPYGSPEGNAISENVIVCNDLPASDEYHVVVSSDTGNEVVGYITVHEESYPLVYKLPSQKSLIIE